MRPCDSNSYLKIWGLNYPTTAEKTSTDAQGAGHPAVEGNIVAAETRAGGIRRRSWKPSLLP